MPKKKKAPAQKYKVPSAPRATAALLTYITHDGAEARKALSRLVANIINDDREAIFLDETEGMFHLTHLIDLLQQFKDEQLQRMMQA